jgi:hypothetical protein
MGQSKRRSRRRLKVVGRAWRSGHCAAALLAALLLYASCAFGSENQVGQLIPACLSLRSYKAAVTRATKKPRLREGEFKGWMENKLLTEVSCVTPDRYRVDLIFPDAHLPRPGGKKKPVDPQQRFLISPAQIAFIANWPPTAFRLDLQGMPGAEGQARAHKQFVDFASEADPVFWLRTLDPRTAKVVEEREAVVKHDDGSQSGQEHPATEPVRAQAGPAEPATGDQETETLYVIEGTPTEPLLLAEADKRQDLPVEPLLRITVGEDGFPRHVLVQCYCPRAEILELTVTDYTLNPDLSDDLFEFRPPEGARVLGTIPGDQR